MEHNIEQVVIKFSTGNAAFAGDNFGLECARILRKLADKIAWAGIGINENINDSNGNTVGNIELMGERQP